MNLIELSNWEGVVLLCLLMLLVWLMVLFQARQSTHEVQLTVIEDLGSEETSHGSDHSDSNEVEIG